eukprot:TRINITY_DN2728_c0_g1_i1.p1 TRINITY_DN2728_c0_g1~~TRINITY_DN2728_c0_g1_i1.p1  ORF type:complete len:428 (+),score=102.95 TRINITY_DN2728_c0_g1_i1:50-1333(+)
MVPSLISGKYRVGRKLGAGSFGEIYSGYDLEQGKEVAIKFEFLRNNKPPQLSFEKRVYNELVDCLGVPKIHSFVSELDMNILVMDLLGPSLADLFESCHRKFSLKTVIQLAIQMLQRIRELHSHNFLHRDIKPENFMIGLGGAAKTVYVIDFGLSKKYRTNNGVHIEYRDDKALCGTARYASINTHRGIEQSRRDDLMSVGYVIVYFLRGQLPWQNLKATTKKQKYQKISERKMATPTEFLCRGLPVEFVIFMNYTYVLSFEEDPDYEYLENLFVNLAERENIKLDGVFDWDGLGGNINISQSVENDQKNNHNMSNIVSHYSGTNAAQYNVNSGVDRKSNPQLPVIKPIAEEEAIKEEEEEEGPSEKYQTTKIKTQRYDDSQREQMKTAIESTRLMLKRMGVGQNSFSRRGISRNTRPRVAAFSRHK